MCFNFRILKKALIETVNFYHGLSKCSGEKLSYEVVSQIFKPFRAVSQCQFWSKLITSEAEQRPMLVAAVAGNTGASELKLNLKIFKNPQE